MRRINRRTLAAAASVVLLAVVAAVLVTSSARRPSRVIVLGIDGLDPATIDLLMSEGKLPNFARMRQDGA